MTEDDDRGSDYDERVDWSDEDLAEERLRASDYEAWANL